MQVLKYVRHVDLEITVKHFTFEKVKDVGQYSSISHRNCQKNNSIYMLHQRDIEINNYK